MGVIRSHDITVIKEIEDSTLKLIPMTDEHLPLLYKWNEKNECPLLV
ncbi:MAG: hypothetical protein ACOX3Q_05265 [Clostridia bacterium]|jgi:hypothetical protein|nr:hypothetical protein [Clostridiaceae bacterium]